MDWRILPVTTDCWHVIDGQILYFPISNIASMGNVRFIQFFRFFFYFSIKNEFAMCDICVHSNYQLHTCGSRTRVTEIISRELPTLECIFIPRCGCNRLRQHTIVHGCWFPGAIIICASVCGNSDENDWKTPWQQPGNGSQSICAFLNKCSSPPQTVFNGSFFFLSYPRLPFRLHLSIPSLPFDSRSPGTPTFLFVPY